MANILLTKKCVRSCPYCFAKEQMSDAADDVLSWDSLIYIADLHEKSNTRHLSLLGGEPTLHPDFISFVKYLVDREFHVNVFTSGIMSKNRLATMQEHLLPIDPKQLSFVCNVNHPKECPEDELSKLYEFFKAFGQHTSTSFNIYKPDFDLGFIFDYIIKFNLRKHIRIGITHPIVGEKNLHIQKEDMPLMAKTFMSFAPLMEKHKVTAGFDCGMPLCLFNDEDLGRMFKINGGRLKFSCGPAIDIGTDMTVWSCFPLGNFDRKSIYEFDSIGDIGKYYSEIHKSLREKKGGLFDACMECEYRGGLCAGGCLSHFIES
jgi:MoaA/NifB/PqqE/SkfB family radical SAM enzyme